MHQRTYYLLPKILLWRKFKFANFGIYLFKLVVDLMKLAESFVNIPFFIFDSYIYLKYSLSEIISHKQCYAQESDSSVM